MLAAQVLAEIKKSAGFGPAIVMPLPVKLTVAVPTLVTVTVCAVVVPNLWVPNARLAADRLMFVANPPRPTVAFSHFVVPFHEKAGRCQAEK